MNGAPGMRTPGSCAEVAQLSLDLPVHQERLGHHVAQEAQPRHDGGEPGRLGDDVGEFDLQNIAGHRALDEHRPGQRMHRAGIEPGEIGGRGARGDLAVDPVARFQRDLFALVDFRHRDDVRMVAVVTTIRFVAQPLMSIDANRAHDDGHPVQFPAAIRAQITCSIQ